MRLLIYCAAVLPSFVQCFGGNGHQSPFHAPLKNPSRRLVVETTFSSIGYLLSASPRPSHALPVAVDSINSETSPYAKNGLKKVTDPNSFSAIAYSPSKTINKKGPPLILVLHGAGRNTENDIWEELANPNGEHAGLIPSLISSGKAPNILLENFAVLAPYSGQNTTSFYELPRGKLLEFLRWSDSVEGRVAGCPQFDPDRIILFGFSDGATVGVELLTTRKFAAGIICSYGYTGSSLPERALERLTDLPLWVFHSQDDAIFSVNNSDKLVRQLRDRNREPLKTVKYSRFLSDPEGLTGSVRGHSMGITASKSPELYEWILNEVV